MKYITLFIAWLFVVDAGATAQMSDKLIYNGEERGLLSNPLESWFEKNPGKKPVSQVRSTALWRGYVATFSITNGLMQVTDIRIQAPKEKVEDGESRYMWVSRLSDVSADGKPFTASWYTGYLIIPDGKRITYVHMGYGSTYSNYILLKVKAGKVLEEKKVDHEGFAAFRNRQFEAFKKSDFFAEHVRSRKDYEPAKDEGFIRSYYSAVYTSMIFEE